MPTEADLLNLLLLPNETLANEYKSWLDLSTNEGKAVLAKAAIALANHGGGQIIMGFLGSAVTALESQQRPVDIPRYSPDIINAAVNRYAEPEIHCDLHFVVHPESGVEHAIISVPGLSSVPIMSMRDCGTTIYKHRCYVRKAGPKSEEPHSAEEWRSLLNRCVQASREGLLDSIRNILQGITPGAASASIVDELLNFAGESRERWRELKKSLSPRDPAHIPLGHYEFTFAVVDVAPAESLAELKKRLDKASAIKHTGWGPFVDIGRAPIAPIPINGVIEAWIGHPDEKGRDGRHADFWRAHPDGKLFLLRAFDEDFMSKAQPGTAVDLTLPIWRFGEALLYAGRFASEFDENPTVAFRAKYIGLKDRILNSYIGMRSPMHDRRCRTDVILLEGKSTVQEITDNLVEIVHPFLRPLYEAFEFYELPISIVTQELERLRNGNF